ncbi:NADPH-dependent FMN reductase [Paucibacter sp. APW11]|uniref:NADPH-dependent FMN reductase n=1 Tax=Roseateles aquae TaxID=3077235 RepID=A0ABU3PF81_9BURK|nr:NADPH-dependent FMN reductase [Paucibacter sp. APW11]MDT9000763.1 NADPH-dependent FMN reductase [Paucibacter sp. APW11]
MHLLALCGSLRAASLNAALLRAAQDLTLPEQTLRLFDGMAALPLFNPDLEAAPPAAVQQLRSAVAAADVLLIASPEYAHGVTAVIKNALDWLVSFEGFVNKPVLVLNASPRASHADAALRETLRTMNARLLDEASLVLPVLGSGLGESELAAHPAIGQPLRQRLAQLPQDLATQD